MTHSAPQGWVEVPLAEIATCQGGSAFSPALQGRTAGDIPFFKVSDMNLPGNGWLMRRANNYVSGSDAHHITGSQKPSGAVIFPKVGAALHTNKKRQLTQASFVDNNVMAVWSGDAERCRPGFLYLYFLTLDLSALSNPGPLPSINNSKVYEQSILLPPVFEQDRIVTTIRLLRRAVENEEKAIATTRDLREALAERLFTVGISRGAHKDSEVGAIPCHWGTAMLGDYALLAQYGLSVRGSEQGRTPILRMNCQRDGAVVFRDLQYVDLDDATRETFRLHDGDLLFNRTNSYELVGRTAVFHSEREAVFASYLIRLRVDSATWLPDFINYYLNRPAVQAELKKLASRGVSQANISASKLKEFFGPTAPLNEQRDIVHALGVVDRDIAVHEKRLLILRDLFAVLLEKLMTGQLRVDKLDLQEPVATQP